MRGVCSTMRRFTMVCLPKLLQMNHKARRVGRKSHLQGSKLELELVAELFDNEVSGVCN